MTKVERVYPSDALTQPVVIPAFTGQTIGYAIESYIPALMKTIDACNGQLKAIRNLPNQE